MRVNPINQNITIYKANSCPKRKIVNQRDVFEFSQKHSPSFCGSINNVSEKQIREIVNLILDSDESRLDGTIQGLYQYGESMVKAPDVMDRDSVVKEYFALNRAKEIDPTGSLAPLPKAISKVGERNFLVEEYVDGVHADQRPFRLSDVRRYMDKFLTMDKGGLISQDLSPRNIKIMPDGTTKIIDFDTFTTLGDDGSILHSQNTMSGYFASRIPGRDIQSVTRGDYLSRSLVPTEEVTPLQRFGRSFFHTRRKPSGMQDLLYIRNMSENPYIMVPSNLTNFESRTMFNRIMNSDVEDPVEFLRSYLQMKSTRYHSSMADYLKTINLHDGTEVVRTGKLKLSEAEANLAKAIEYEEFLARLFKDKPDPYFAKLEAAKIQVNALLYHEDFDRHLPNKSQLHAAYDKLMKIITDGIQSYPEPDYQRYLRTELTRYRDAFESTDFSIREPDQGILKRLNMLETWFGSIGTDKGSFVALKDSIKEQTVDSIYSYIQSVETKALTRDVIVAGEMDIAKASAARFMSVLGDRVPKRAYELGAREIAQEAIAEAHGSAKYKQLLSKAASDLTTIVGDITDREAPKSAFRRVSKSYKPSKPMEETLKSFGKKYQKHHYEKMGGGVFIGLGAIIAAGSLMIKKYNEVKSRNKIEVKLQEAPNPQKVKTPIQKELMNTPFKDFVK